MYLSVDLASKFSAAILREAGGKILWQGDSAGKSPREWVQELARVAHGAGDVKILVEDVPYGVKSQAMTKPVLRLQGMLILALDVDFHFINPATWMKDYEGVARAPKGMSKSEGLKYRNAKALEHARELGYEPPDLISEWQKKNPDLKPLAKYTNDLKKSQTDYVMAFLINDWLVRHKHEYTTLSGVQLAMI